MAVKFTERSRILSLLYGTFRTKNLEWLLDLWEGCASLHSTIYKSRRHPFLTLDKASSKESKLI